MLLIDLDLFFKCKIENGKSVTIDSIEWLARISTADLM